MGGDIDLRKKCLEMELRKLLEEYCYGDLHSGQVDGLMRELVPFIWVRIQGQ